ncbi:uncharacterized protein HMPREF1541_00197 [Cyphellophora europaea CBS 101466]|uniref:Histone-lysine N-methyltransferase n=1 Tax=Cyphellophora europaea (strain CBS 101466) TaxID=1220924 RepID=W2SDP5_CYPE1|nr:uncharacterized protein HMPREF1541_00197 [Cyphellophora europaea CBS 101466]ETN46014.1 hypothetical protein HMPREF1541_00197 [Cyphellophora europaea CBS 101466]
MPLRQTLLSFAAALASPKQHELKSNRRSSLSRALSSNSSDTSDTIEVEVTEPPLQLPTPDETATESSSVASSQDLLKAQGRRVSKRMSKGRAIDRLSSAKKGQEQYRTVSGETLVNSVNASQDSLLKKGVDALDLPWNMSDVFNIGSKADLTKSTNPKVAGSTETVNTMAEEDSEDSEDEKERAAKAAAKKKKIEQNNRLWEKRKKMAEKNATRRSSRAPTLSRAAEFASGIAETVLGKRKDRTSDLRGSLRPRSAMEQGAAVADEPIAKKRRVTDNVLPFAPQTTTTSPLSKKAPRAPKDKKWLTSGLYAGQKRQFDARHHGGTKGKRKSAGDAGAEKENSILPLPMFFGERLLNEGRDFKLPFDVFSPLPPGQPKPDEWRKSNKNIFVGDAAQEWRVIKDMEYSACICTPETGCDQDCMNRYMYYECDSKNCNLTAEQCGNRAFDDLRKRVKKGGKYNIGVEVIKTDTRGYGVRSNRTFDPNQVIVEYSGEVINQDECDRRMRKEYKNNECYYLMLFDQNMIIDATTKGSIARFVNHSCNPNCRMEKWTVNGKPRMALFAGEGGIMTGEELTYDYNFDPFSQKNVQECRCGEERCRGVLGPRPKKDERKSEEKEDEPKEKKSLKRKVADAIGDAVEKVTKKRKTETQVQVKTTKARSRIYSNSPKKTTTFTAKAKAVAKAVRGSSASPIKASTGLARNPSKLKRMVNGAKERATSAATSAKASAAAGIQKSRSGRRIVSTTSATEALLEKEVTEQNGTKRTQLKSKVGSVKTSVVKTMRGRQSGQGRSMRVVDSDE